MTLEQAGHGHCLAAASCGPVSSFDALIELAAGGAHVTTIASKSPRTIGTDVFSALRCRTSGPAPEKESCFIARRPFDQSGNTHSKRESAAVCGAEKRRQGGLMSMRYECDYSLEGPWADGL